jgi:biotin operon repressor
MLFRVLVRLPDEDPHSGPKLAAQLYVTVKQPVVCDCEY